MKSSSILAREAALERLSKQQITIDPDWADQRKRQAFALFVMAPPNAMLKRPKRSEIAEKVGVTVTELNLWISRYNWVADREAFDKGVTTPWSFVTAREHTQVSLIANKNLARIDEIDVLLEDIAVEDPEFQRLRKLRKELMDEYKEETGVAAMRDILTSVEKAKAVGKVKMEFEREKRRQIRREQEEAEPPPERDARPSEPLEAEVERIPID